MSCGYIQVRPSFPVPHRRFQNCGVAEISHVRVAARLNASAPAFAGSRDIARLGESRPIPLGISCAWPAAAPSSVLTNGRATVKYVTAIAASYATRLPVSPVGTRIISAQSDSRLSTLLQRRLPVGQIAHNLREPHWASQAAFQARQREGTPRVHTSVSMSNSFR